MYITRLASNEIFSPSNKIHREVGRAKDLPAPLYFSVSTKRQHKRRLSPLRYLSSVFAIIKVIPMSLLLLPQSDCNLDTTVKTDKPPCTRLDSNPQSQQASGRRPTPEVARPLGSALVLLHTAILRISRLLSYYTSQQDFGTRKVYFVSNVTFYTESKYAIKIFPSPTVFVQWPF